MKTDDFTDDLLTGAEAIAAYIRETERRTYYLLKAGLIPAFREGAKWRTTKSGLRAHYEKKMGGDSR
jgi:hypothetical protein